MNDTGRNPFRFASICMHVAPHGGSRSGTTLSAVPLVPSRPCALPSVGFVPIQTVCPLATALPDVSGCHGKQIQHRIISNTFAAQMPTFGLTHPDPLAKVALPQRLLLLACLLNHCRVP
ncbi:uncharacterized protein LY79DRAFT_537787 [Colletotrichum navitas]|uniref:Uncharacterized protein n=1 Tax=Colletotrichum navitas TaxID=681940 RepID=A0AAD8QBK5_9PEZI|nr:uncharacterized protein LY79DRAFT_537787 [Colletotrichum navitas]KAK1598662.1 hypothetical protein LY79DRAFT_537787 [Colletotrichum navitas]